MTLSELRRCYPCTLGWLAITFVAATLLETVHL